MDRGKRPHKNRERGKDIEKWQTDGQEGERKLGGREALEFEVTTVSKISNFRSFARLPTKMGSFYHAVTFFHSFSGIFQKRFKLRQLSGDFSFQSFTPQRAS